MLEYSLDNPSRKRINALAQKLSQQAQNSLWELLKGLQDANEAASGRLLLDLPTRDPQHLADGLRTVIMRLIVLLYIEDQGVMPTSPTYTENYSIGHFFERLRQDAGRYPDTMDQRFGAWAWLLSTFRMVFDGGGHGGLRLPTRHGQLFNPDEYPFLEGRPPTASSAPTGALPVPRVSDGVVWRVLEGLLMLDGERLSYRALDVEQVGSVYESMMGFDVRTLPGRAISVRPKNIVVDLDALLQQPPSKRAAWLKENADCDLAAGAAKALAAATTVDAVVAALGRKVWNKTPQALAPGALFLQPGEERRRSGSHYTPRELTEPIVRTTLRPVLEALGPKPTAEQILDLKVCDPAMGSGAFLVESCRQLAAALVAAWEANGTTPKLPPDEEPLLHARRLVAQRCLYGVDKNPFAVNLAKLSLWLVTLARDHAFTFLDHALKHGDSLVGLNKAQLGAFHWQAGTGQYVKLAIDEDISEAMSLRLKIRELAETDDDGTKQQLLDRANAVLSRVRLLGDAVVASFFSSDKDRVRQNTRNEWGARALEWFGGDGTKEAAFKNLSDTLRRGERTIPCFHWDLEFPEVFDRTNPGFDAIVGNPPFAGKNTTINGNRDGYVDWLQELHEGAHGNADLVAHFYRRSFGLIRERGTFGLIATNTIGQGDTRSTGLRWICTHGGEIYSATRRVKWPGLAAVVVSVVHLHRGEWSGSRTLDGRQVDRITAFLFHGGGHENPAVLRANEGKSFVGSYVLGMGFTFDDTDRKGVASPLSEMKRLIEKDQRNAERIFPYIGGEEVNSSPTHSHHRYVINFGEMTEAEARQWPELMEIVEAKVRPERQLLADNNDGRRRKTYWWHWGRYTPALYRAIAGMERVLVTPRTSTWLSFAFLSADHIFSENTVVFPLSNHSGLACLHCRVHETWVRFFSSTLGDAVGYRPSDCFETFPFPLNWQTNAALESAGQAYYDFRAELMVRNNEGLTQTYNRFHDPNERSSDILRLRELHNSMDRAVLDAYGWTDISTECDFYLDYEIDEESWGDRRKPYRYRWPDAARDEVLARLLELNKQRHAEEVAAGLHTR